MLRLPTRLGLLLAMCGPLAGQAFGQSINVENWLADFAQLKQELATHYANLEWAIAARGLDLRKLSHDADARLRLAQTDAEAQGLLRTFLRAFGDGHVDVRWVSAAPAPEPAPTALCERLGYRTQDVRAGVDFASLPGFVTLSTPDSARFPAGVLPLAGGRRVGVLRIALFVDTRFPDLCAQAVAALGLPDDAPTDSSEGPVDRATANLLTASVVRQVEALKRQGMDMLVVDVTGNGGGSNWLDPVARTLTGVRLRSPRTSFIRHPHYVRIFRERIGEMEAALGEASPEARPLVEQALRTYRQAMDEAARPCDRMGLWANEPPSCALVATAPALYASGLLPYARPGALPPQSWQQHLFYPSRYEYQEGVYSGPLVILVDGGTASAAEYFAAMLRDNGAAVLVGAPTYGAGCGHVNGGVPAVLRHSGARVTMPDCVRLRADGSNEVAGITPDVLIPWRASENPYQRARRAAEALALPLPRLPRNPTGYE